MRLPRVRGGFQVKDETAVGGDSRKGLRLRLIATTDLHVHLLPYDYYTDLPQPAKGLAQAASLIRALRAEMPDGSCLLLDNGDALSGSLLSDLLSTRFRLLAPPGGAATPIHPMIAAMNALGYDAGTLGNHEFDHGLSFLRNALSAAAFPIVSANLLGADGAPLVAPWTILDRDLPDQGGGRHRIRVGILGLGPPQTAHWTGVGLGGALVARDLLESAREEIPRIRAAGADIVVALCHSGIGEEDHAPMMENAAVPLAALDGLDAVVAGHTHLTFPSADWQGTAAVDPLGGTIHGKPAVQPGSFGSHVGVMDLWLDRGSRGWEVGAHIARSLPVPPDAPADGAVVASVAPSHRRLLGMTRRLVGRTRVPLQSYFSLVGADAAMDVVADAKRREAERLLRGRAEVALPILCTVSPCKAGGRAGPATTSTSRRAPSPSARPPTSTSITTPSASSRSPGGACANGSNGAPPCS